MSSLRLRIPLAAASLVAAALALAALLDGAESLLIAGLVLGAVAGLLGVLASRSLLRPLASVKQAAAAIAAGDFGARVWPRPAILTASLRWPNGPRRRSSWPPRAT